MESPIAILHIFAWAFLWHIEKKTPVVAILLTLRYNNFIIRRRRNYE